MTSSTKLIQAASGVGGDTDFYPYTVDNSCRFNDADSTKLTKTFSTPTSDKKFVFSTWFKISEISNSNQIFSSGTSATNYAFITVSDGYFWYIDYTGSNTLSLRTYGKKLFRDPSAWYHIVVAVDTTQSTSTDRVNVYFNGELYTDWEASQSNHGSQNYTPLLCAANPHSIGAGTQSYASSYVNGYLSQSVFIDGQQLAASDFGEDNNGIWVPKSVSGLTFGTNGFYLDFADSSALGNDVSGNNNDWTVSGLAANDQMIDTPTNNYAAWNPLKLRDTASANWPLETYSEGNLTTTHPSSISSGTSYTTVGVPDDTKMYCEIYVSAIGGGTMGIDSGLYGNTGSASDRYLYAKNGSISGPSSSTSGSSYTTGDIIGICINRVSDEVAFYKNGSLQGTLSGLSDVPFFPFILADNNASRILNAGQNGTFNGNVTAGGNTDANDLGDFKYTVPTDALAFCTANLPEPTIGPNSETLTSEVFAPILYTGNGTVIGSGGKTISSLAFQPDFTWIKNRDAADSHMLFDAVRGATKYLNSDLSNNNEITDTESLTSFTATGFTLGNNVAVNTNTEDYVAWNWKANGSGATNEDGSVTSTVSANQDAGISVATFTTPATGTGFTVGHGLGTAPDFLILRGLQTDRAWWVWHKDFSPTYYYLYLSDSYGFSGLTQSTNAWNNAVPTSTVFSARSDWQYSTNVPVVAYAFAEKEGFSSFGSYTGNGSTDGPFIYCGFSPAFVMVKKTSGNNDWAIWDSARDTYNVSQHTLAADLPNAEYNGNYLCDFLSNGFKLKNDVGISNDNGSTYIYMAFAENPFKYSNAR